MTNRGEKSGKKQTHNNAAQEERERIMRDSKTGRSCRLPGSSKVAADVLLILEWVGSKEKKGHRTEKHRRSDSNPSGGSKGGPRENALDDGHCGRFSAPVFFATLTLHAHLSLHPSVEKFLFFFHFSIVPFLYLYLDLKSANRMRKRSGRRGTRKWDGKTVHHRARTIKIEQSRKVHEWWKWKQERREAFFLLPFSFSLLCFTHERSFYF